MKVLSLIDSLIAAGAERMAVNIANGLASAGVESHLCATRFGGPLEEFVSKDVSLLIAGKRNFYDLKTLLRIRKYIRDNQIGIVHAHSSAVYWAVILKWITPGLKVVWHDHFGFSDKLDKRSSSSSLRFMAKWIDHVFVVNEKLLNYAKEVLKVPEKKVSFLANFADLDFNETLSILPDIPDVEMSPKLICLANIRPQKDHNNLLSAFKVVRQKFPQARLYLVGGHFNDEYYHHVLFRIKNEELLQNAVHVLGSRNDVASILNACDLGILSSLSEGLPVSLLEYGLAGLPVVCTNVGDCATVLDYGRCGKLVEAGNDKALAEAIIQTLDDKEVTKDMAANLKQRIISEFSREGAVKKIIDTYNCIYGK